MQINLAIDSVLEDQAVYPLYLSKNYILEGEFTAYGFDNIPLLLYCNSKLLYNEKVPPEITTFSLDISKLEKFFDINKEYTRIIISILSLQNEIILTNR